MAVKKSKFSETQVAAALRECASGTPVGQVSRAASAGPCGCARSPEHRRWPRSSFVCWQAAVATGS